MYRFILDRKQKRILMMITFCMLLMVLTGSLYGCKPEQENFPVIEERVEDVYQGVIQEESIDMDEAKVTTQTEAAIDISSKKE